MFNKDKIKRLERELKGLQLFILENFTKYKQYDHIEFKDYRNNKVIGCITDILLRKGKIIYIVNGDYEVEEKYIIKKCKGLNKKPKGE